MAVHEPVLVMEHALRVVDRDGTTYHVRVWARPEAKRRWNGYLEFVPTGGRGSSERTGRETTQPSTAEIARWAAALGPLYLEGALERAHLHSGVDTDGSPVLVQVHEDLVTDGERSFRARTWARREPAGLVAWLEFTPVDGGPVLSTPHETSQSDLEAIAYWSSGLSPIYLEGALARARRVRGEP